MSFQLTKTVLNEQGLCRLSIAGDLTIYEAEGFRSQVSEMCSDIIALEVDTSDVDEFDTAGAQLLVALAALFRRDGHAFSLGKKSTTVECYMKAMGLLNADIFTRNTIGQHHD